MDMRVLWIFPVSEEAMVTPIMSAVEPPGRVPWMEWTTRQLPFRKGVIIFLVRSAVSDIPAGCIRGRPAQERIQALIATIAVALIAGS